MLLFDGLLGLVMVGLWLFCIIDVITTPAESVRNLPKLAWLLIVVVLAEIGSIAWLVAGRDWSGTPRTLAYRAYSGDGTRREPGRSAPPRRATNPDDDEEFLAGLQARADEQRRRAREKDEGGAAAG